MCMRHCFETHRDFGRSEAEQLFSAPSFSSLIKTSHMTGSKFLVCRILAEINYCLYLRFLASFKMRECLSLLRDSLSYWCEVMF